MPKGKLIVFEGADNLGKTTQIDALFSYLRKKNINVMKTREPGATNLGSKIREILLNSTEKIPPKAQLLLFQADRNIHSENILKPYLEKGYIILCDRFYLSTLVYQHKLNGTSENAVYDLNAFSTDYLVPDKVFVFHGTMLTDEARDEYEKHTVNKNHEKLNNYYIEYGMVLPNHILINANRSKEVIFDELLTYIEEWI
jgi:dTMP kinase